MLLIACRTIMNKAYARHLVVFLCIHCCCLVLVEAGIVAKSSITQCIMSDDVKGRSGKPCSKMLVVALTITGHEGKTQYMEADVSKVVDTTNPQKAKNVQLKYPIRLRIKKSPVIVHFDLTKVATFNHHPYEVLRKRRKCRDDWYAKNKELGCPRKYTPSGEKIFDSQGRCCSCNRKSTSFNRAMTFQRNCMGHKKTKVAHCMELSPLIDHAYELMPAKLVFTISVDIEEKHYTVDDKPYWEKISTLKLGPHRRISSSSEYMVRAEYIADFHPDSFAKVGALMSKYVVLPDLDDLKAKLKKDPSLAKKMKKRGEIHFIRNSSEWLVVEQHMVALQGGGSACNKMGVGYSDFRWQPDFCSNKQHSCLYYQAHSLYWADKKRMKRGRAPQNMLFAYGKLHSITKSKFSWSTGFLRFKANRPKKSLVVVNLAADDLKVVTNISPGRIVEAYIDPFEALTESGKLMVIVQNMGTVTASYQVFVVHCSAGIDFVPSDIITLNPQQTSNLTFNMHSVYTIGKINKCDVELHNPDGMKLDNMSVFFETEDTCFCYGHCGCACGNSTSTCPPPPTYHKDDKFKDLDKLMSKKFRLLNKFKKFMVGNIGKFVLVSWFFYLLMCLGLLKVLHMLLTGQVDYPAITNPASMGAKKVFQLQKKVFDKWCPAFYNCVCGTFQRCCLCCCAFVGQRLTGQKDHTPTTIQMNDYERGWRRPRACNGMCSGAHTARRLHRKQMRINKRRGMKNETAWYQKKYECTCKVSDTMPCCDICKGLFFFFYLPILPLWWVLEFVWGFIKRKWQRHKRKKRYRAMKASQAEKEKDCYLSVDQYTRGKVEKQILGISQKNKTRKAKQKNKVNEGFNAQESSECESSDTTDQEQAGDIDELLSPEYPVFFNYAGIQPNKAPSSLQSPGSNFTIKGKLTEKDGGYIFELAQYTHQVNYMCSEKVKVLKPAKALDTAQFRRKMNEATALQLITLSPLFTTMNDVPK